MQQAARCADQVAFFYLGEMVEVAPAAQMFTAPQGTPHAGIHHRPVRLSGGARHVRSAGTPRQELRPGTEAAAQHDDRRWAASWKARSRSPPMRSCSATPPPPRARWRRTRRSMRWSARSSTFVIRLLALRQPVAGDLRQIVAALKITGDLERIGDYAANVAKRIDRAGAVLAALFARRPRAHGAPGAGAVEVDHRRARRQRRRQGDRGLALRPGGGRHLQRDLPRADHLHDGRSAQHHAVHAPAVHRQEPGADRRSRHQHRRERCTMR